MKKYTIELTEKQARLLSWACDRIDNEEFLANAQEDDDPDVVEITADD